MNCQDRLRTSKHKQTLTRRNAAFWLTKCLSHQRGEAVRELLAERVDKHPAVAEPRCKDAPSIDAILPFQLI
jgi:hypothetical protein